MAKKPKTRVSQESIDWHIAALNHALKAVESVEAKGRPIDQPTKNVIMRRLERLEGFVFAHYGKDGFPFQKAPFDAEDAAALILWPRWKALRLAKKLFHLSTGSQLKVPRESEGEILELAVESFNMDWFDYKLS